MANEVTISATLAYADAVGVSDLLSITNFIQTIATKAMLHNKQLVGLTQSSLNLGGIAEPGYIIAINRDDTNFVQIQVASSGAAAVYIGPGGVAVFEFGTGAQVPFVIADTAPVYLEYILCSA